MSFVNLALIIIFFMSFSNGLSLVFNRTYSAYKNKYLGVTVMVYSLFLLSYVWWYREEFILEAPFLMRSVSPFLFTAMPFFYFFVRNTLSGEDKLRKTDFFHFLPAIIHLIELIPFYLKPNAEKLLIAEQVVGNPIALDSIAYGLIPGNWVAAIRFLLQFGYYFLSIKILFKKEVNTQWGGEAVSVRNWLIVAVALIGFLLLAHLLFAVRNVLDLASYMLPSVFERVINFMVTLPLVLLTVYMRYNHQLVYGYTLQTILNEKKKAADVSQTFNLDTDNTEEPVFANVDIGVLQKDLESLMNEQELYKNADLVLKEVSDSVGVNQRIVSQFIKVKYGMGFKEFVNKFRIEAAIALMKAGFLENHSLEGLCQTVGFNSRVTFFLAFKKYTGMSPTEYLRHEFP